MDMFVQSGSAWHRKISLHYCAKYRHIRPVLFRWRQGCFAYLENSLLTLLVRELLHCCLSFSSHGFWVSFSSSFSGFLIFRCVLLMFLLSCFPAFLSRLLSCFSIPSQLVSCQTRAGLPWLYMESWDSHACNCLHEASWPPCDQSWKRQPHEQSYLY